MGNSQSCAELTILSMIMMVAGLFGFMLLVPQSASETGFSEPAIQEAEVSSSSSESCVWTWATENDAEGAARLQASLEDAGFAGVEVFVSVFGENCSYMNSDQEGYFAAMDSSPNITIPLASHDQLADTEGLGNLVAEILPIIDNAGLTTPRELVISFEADGESVEWRAISSDVNRTLSGEEMFAAGSSNP